MPYYVNFRGAEGVETLDECDTYAEAAATVAEYVMAFQGEGSVYVSKRPTREFRTARAMDALLADSAAVG